VLRDESDPGWNAVLQNRHTGHVLAAGISQRDEIALRADLLYPRIPVELVSNRGLPGHRHHVSRNAEPIDKLGALNCGICLAHERERAEAGFEARGHSGIDLASGRFIDGGHSARAERVAILGPDAARRLGIAGVERLPAIYVGDELYLVIGVLRDVVRKPELLGSVIIPEGTARRHFSLFGPGMVVVETKIGAASLIALQARAALRPDDPRTLRVQLPQEPRRVRDDVQTDLNMMFLLLGGLSLVVGALGIANITLVGVMERTAEIGLRRAIGATRRHIASQFLIESASMGVVGGLLGSSVGVLIVVGVSAYQVWTPVLDPLAPLLAPAVGGVIGLLSGVYPASRAAALEPAEAFRH